MVTFAEQRLLDNNAKFNTAEQASSINYAGADIPAIVGYGEERKALSAGDAVGDFCTIRVRRADISTTAPGTLVTIHGKPWKVKAPIGGNALNLEIALRANVAPIPRGAL